MTDEINGGGDKQMMTPEEAASLHDMCMEIDDRLNKIALTYPKAFGSALFTLATFACEKVYCCSPDIDEAQMLLARANEQGIDNWVAWNEAQRKAEKPSIILPN